MGSHIQDVHFYILGIGGIVTIHLLIMVLLYMLITTLKQKNKFLVLQVVYRHKQITVKDLIKQLKPEINSTSKIKKIIIDLVLSNRIQLDLNKDTVRLTSLGRLTYDYLKFDYL